MLTDLTAKRYLVTGGCGFIGSHLVDALIEEGHEVVILDNLSTGKRENAHPKALLVIGDTTDYDAVEHVFDGIDGCFHLAAIASVEKSVVEWAGTHTVNATSTVNVFQAASRRDDKIPVVYTSSAAVYGNCPFTPISETVRACPLTAYGADKLACDLHGQVAWTVHGVPNIGLRPFNIYGPRQDPSSPYSGVISIFTDRIQRGLPITIYGDGDQIRDFVYVADAVKGFMAAMESLHEEKHPSGHDEINLCTGLSTSIKHLAEVVANEAGRQIHYTYAPSRQGDIRVSVGNPARLISRFGFKLERTLQEGLHATMAATKPSAQKPLHIRTNSLVLGSPLGRPQMPAEERRPNHSVV